MRNCLLAMACLEMAVRISALLSVFPQRGSIIKSGK